MEWRKAWREGVAPLLSTMALEGLRRGLETDDPALVQGSTTVPPPLAAVQQWPCEGACALGYAGWKGEELTTVAEVEEFFARMCFDIDQRLGESAACRWFLNPFDENPRSFFFPQLLEEVKIALEGRTDGTDHSGSTGDRLLGVGDDDLRNLTEEIS